MRRSERVLFGLVALVGAGIAGVDAALAAEAVDTAGRGSTLTMFGIGTLVPAVLVYAFFRRRELKTAEAGEMAVAPRAKPPKARKVRVTKPKAVAAEPAVSPGVAEPVAAPGAEPPRRLNPAGPNPLELALVAKAMPVSAVMPVPETEASPDATHEAAVAAVPAPAAGTAEMSPAATA
jgi:hypothetical protein